MLQERQVSELNSDNTQVNSSASNCSMEENEDENTEVNNDVSVVVSQLL